MITSGAKIPFQRFVVIGRVAVLTDGACADKITAIVDVIDQNRVLLDGLCSEIPRQEYKIKSLHLTLFKAKSAQNKIVAKAVAIKKNKMSKSRDGLGVDAMILETSEKFDEFSKAVVLKVQLFPTSTHYNDFDENLIKELILDLSPAKLLLLFFMNT